MLLLKDLNIVCSKKDILALPRKKLLINTLNAHSFNVAQHDERFAKA